MSRVSLLLGLLMCAGAGDAVTGATPAAAPEQACQSLAEYHRLDFWIGSWDVFVDGQLDGHNEVSRILGGCVIQESWRDVAGYEGRSWFYVDPASHRLKQIWITSMALQPGGVKEKQEVTFEATRAARFEGLVRGVGGDMLHDRTTLTAQTDGTVRQQIELSRDGVRYRTLYDALYRPAQPPAGTAGAADVNEFAALRSGDPACLRWSHLLHPKVSPENKIPPCRL
jgi:hypothetical protein